MVEAYHSYSSSEAIRDWGVVASLGRWRLPPARCHVPGLPVFSHLQRGMRLRERAVPGRIGAREMAATGKRQHGAGAAAPADKPTG
jgi:hypothetical protein